MCRPLSLSRLALAGAAAAVTVGAVLADGVIGHTTLLGVPGCVYLAKAATLAVGLALLALLEGDPTGQHAPLRARIATGTRVYLAGMAGCLAGLIALANLPASAVGASVVPAALAVALAVAVVRVRTQRQSLPVALPA
jgi:hypothetical protein